MKRFLVLALWLVLSLCGKSSSQSSLSSRNDVQSVNMKGVQAERVETQSLKSQSLKVGALSVAGSKVVLGENTLFQVGDNAPVSVKDLVAMAEYTRRLMDKCGPNMERCVLAKEQAVLKSLEGGKTMRFLQSKAKENKEEEGSEENQLDEQVDELLN